MSEHRQGIDPGFLIRHRLHLVGNIPVDIDAMVAALEQLPAVDQVQFNAGRQCLKVAYDASHHNIDEMIAIVEQHGASIKNNWWNRLLLGWQRQTDENIKQNARHVAHCCSKPPPTINRHR